MRYLSLFSGIEAATVAWEGLGWECVAVSEIDPFACAVLAHHYPNVPNLGSVTEITQKAITNLGHIDLVVFGSPCQNLSVAGNRKGLGGDQSGLFFDAIRVIQYARLCGCRFALWENVPGAFSSNKGRDFAAVVEHMAGLTDVGLPKNGWGKEGAAVGDNGLLEWACLDAQFFGLAQRRKRVFAIVDFGDWASRPPILLERQSLRGDIAPSRTARQDLAATAIGSTTVDSICLNPESPQCWRIYNPGGVSPTLQSGEKRGNIVLSKSTSPVPNYKAACFTHTSRDEVRL
ncbi:MAG: DNA (cytosine-5-)-methyltransferase, partial [Psychrobacter sp.]|nr:DNA (cytosine-5-)-methyltransferase [Psychrobacter sp.]